MGRNSRSESSTSSPQKPSSFLENFIQQLQNNFTKREQIFLGLLVTLILLFNVVFTDLAETLSFFLFNGALVYVAYQLAPLLYTSLHFIEKELVPSKGKAVLITGKFF